MPNGLSDLELFRAIADGGSLAAAGNRLGLSPSVVSRRLKAIEDRLGVKLVERTARRFHLTPEGELYRQRCDEILSAIHMAEDEVSTGAQSAKGLLRIGAPMELGRRYIAPLIASFLSQHSGMHAYLALSDMGWEVGRDRLDLALRVGRPEDPAVIARRIATTRRVLCAAPDYLARRGQPECPDDLADHDCLVLERRTHVWDHWGSFIS